MSKVIQNLPNNTRNAAHLALVGWHTLDTKISIMKLSFLWRLLCLPIDNIYRRILTFFLHLCLYDNYVNLKSPTYSIFTYVKRYSMTHVLIDSLHSDNQGKIAYYKKMIKTTVFKYEACCWKATMFLLHNLPFYECSVLSIKLHPWWYFVKASPSYYRQVSSIVALICGSQPKFLQCNFDDKFCCLCCDRSIDTPIHILFECSSLDIVRNLYLGKVRLSMPLAMKNEFNNMTNSNKCLFILSAMNSKFCVDFMLIYKSMSSFVFEMYRERYKLYKRP